MNYNKIGEFIQEKRKEKNLTQKELATKIGVTDKAVSKWERGLGCPDVSILEILANELDVSILEILKGRIIENEVIKVTEANDYVKDTINYSKEKIKDLINKIIVFMIFSISILLIILNIINMIKINVKYYPYDFDNEIIENAKTDLEKLKENVKIINNSQGLYSDEDYNKIVNILEENIQKIENNDILKYSQIKNFTIKELYNFDTMNPTILGSIELIRIIEKYDEQSSFRRMLTDNYIAKIYLSDDFYKRTLKSYKYSFLDIPNELELQEFSYNYDMYARVINFKSIISSYLYLTDQIIRVGEINE